MFPRVNPASLVDTKALNKAEVLAVLFNTASKIGHGQKDPGPNMISIEEAQDLLDATRRIKHFDYLHGKRMKINLDDLDHGVLDAIQYDLYYGVGTAAMAIHIYWETCDLFDPRLQQLQQDASQYAYDMCNPPGHSPGAVRETTMAQAMNLLNPPEGDTPAERNLRGFFKKMEATPCTEISL